MELQDEKCVMVMEEGLPLGVAANAAAILGISLGRELPETVGPDVIDRSGREHVGIVAVPVPILKGTPERIREIRERLYEPDFSDLTVVDFSELAQGCKNYEEFVEKMGRTAEGELRYFGLAICGQKKKVNRLTGNLPLLR